MAAEKTRKVKDTVIQTQMITTAELFQGEYTIPDIQRDYTWNVRGKNEYARVLWDDALQFFKNNKDTEAWKSQGVSSFGDKWYVLGPMITSTEKQDTYEIFDGQQRVTTLSLLFLAARDALDYMIMERNHMEKHKDEPLTSVESIHGKKRFHHPCGKMYTGTTQQSGTGRERSNLKTGTR